AWPGAAGARGAGVTPWNLRKRNSLAISKKGIERARGSRDAGTGAARAARANGGTQVHKKTIDRRWLPLNALRVQMAPSFAVQLAVPILRDFRRISSEVDIDLISPYGVGPPLGDVDVAVVYSRPTVSDLVTDLLWPVRLSILCHPNIAAGHRGKDLAAFIE